MVKGGGCEYVCCMVVDFVDVWVVMLVVVICCVEDGVYIFVVDGVECYDDVVFVCYSDQMLVIFGNQVIVVECVVFVVVGYQFNWVVVYIDVSFLLQCCKFWLVWNYVVGVQIEGYILVVVFYLINMLQLLLVQMLVIVLFNFFQVLVLDKVIVEIDYVYSVFDQCVVVVQNCLFDIQGCDWFWFCGVWGCYGFYEDGLCLVLVVVVGMGGIIFWWQMFEGVMV